MKKLFLISMLALLGVCVFAQNLKLIDLGGEGESYLFFNDEELYLVLPYVGEYAKLDRKALNYDKDGFLKFNYKDKSLLIIDGDRMRQYFTDFQNDGENKYDDSNDGFHNYNIKNISASSSFSETIKGRKISYTPDNLGKCFYIGCKCHPYWWNYAHIPWVEGVAGNGTGESVTIEYEKDVCGISILNGYTDINNMKLFKENARIKTLLIEDCVSGKSQTVELEDKVYFYYVPVENTTKIRLTIKDVYPGTKYQDTCLSAVIDHTYQFNGNNRYDYFLRETKNLHLEPAETVLEDYFVKEIDLFKNKYPKN